MSPKQWALHYGGNDVDIPLSIKFTNDGGTIVAGYTDSKSGDVSPQPNREYWDLWIVSWINAASFNGKDPLAEQAMKVQEM